MSHTQKRLVVTTQDDQATGCASFEDRQSYSPDTIVLYHDNAKADARRLVACWNACDGISTEALEQSKPMAQLVIDHAMLIDALETVTTLLRGDGRFPATAAQLEITLANHGRSA